MAEGVAVCRGLWKKSLLSLRAMHASFEPNHYPVTGAAAVPALLFHLHDDNPQSARVAAAQQLLFPATPRGVCEEMHLNWWAVLKLYEDGWLSFSPENTPTLDEAQEAELRFVGSLVLTGCDRNMLSVLLSGLPKPYAYDLRRLYFDWNARRWRLLPDPHAHPEAAFTDWLETLVHQRDTSSLAGIGELARDALARVHVAAPRQEAPSPWSATTDQEAAQG
jgi:hypothetical protein